MFKYRKLIFTLTKPVFIWNCFVTLACLPYLYFYNLAALPLVLFFKLVGYIATVGIVYLFTQNKFYFFRNAGYSISRLFGTLFIIDFSVHLVIIILFLIIRPWLLQF